jgi:membrane protease YdiL (CAAX protease family)
VRTRPPALALFLLLTFVPAWALWIGSGVLSRAGKQPADAAWLMAQLGVFSPALAAFVVASLERPDARKTTVRLAGFLYLPALVLGAVITTRGFDDLRRVGAVWLLPVGLLALASLVLLGRGDGRVEPWPLGGAGRGVVALWTAGAALLPVAVYGAAWAAGGAAPPAAGVPAAAPYRDLTAATALLALGWNLVFGGSLGEEPGWRGFLLPRLLADRTPFGASLVVGFWWGAWHAPIDWVQGFVVSGPGALVARQVWTLPLAVLFAWVTVRAGGSLLPAIACHTALNAVPDFGLVDPARYASATAGFWAAALVAAVAVMALDPVLLRLPGARPAESGPRT